MFDADLDRAIYAAAAVVDVLLLLFYLQLLVRWLVKRLPTVPPCEK